MRFICLLASFCALAAAGELKLGKPLRLTKPAAVSDVMAAPDEYVGKTVQVKGKITAVCQMMGCWIELADASGSALRVKVNDGAIIFPKDSSGRVAIAEGKFVRLTLSKEQAIARARHEAGEQGRPFDPKSVPGPAVIYQLEGAGAVLPD